MKKNPESHALIYSPSDIVRFMESPYSIWMNRYHLEFPGELTPDEDDEERLYFAKEGQRHESRFLKNLREEGRNIVEIPRGAESIQLTQAALDRREEVVFQAHLQMDHFEGFADFLTRVGDSSDYEVWDTKLARTTKPGYLIQLCCYAEMLESMGFRLPVTLKVALGNGEIQKFRTNEYIYAYFEAKSAFLEMMDQFDPNDCPAPDPRRDHGRWASHADQYLLERDHLVQIAGINQNQIKKIELAGINTMSALAESADLSVPKIADDILDRLILQARLQVASNAAPQEKPAFEIISPNPEDVPTGLELLPPDSPNDIFFDLEGFPLAADGQGLEYLWGATSLSSSREPQFKDWWAHDAAEEKKAFEDFVDWAYQRWTEDPTMHIYHYGHYEITALKRLMGAFGSREREVDTFLRKGVFIDLYQVVKQGVRIGDTSYSLKKVEQLYMESRAADVKTASGSVVAYANWLENDESKRWQESPMLKEIRDYNQEDCDSTWMLTEWLRTQQAEHEIPYRTIRPETPVEPAPPSEKILRRQEVAKQLLLFADNPGLSESDANISRLLSYAVDYHRREDKPGWWTMFDRLSKPPEALVEDKDCLGNLQRTSEPTVPIKRSTGFHCTFDPDQQTKLYKGKRGLLSTDGKTSVTIEEIDTENGRALVKLSNKKLAEIGGELPTHFSLVPCEFVSPEIMAAAIQRVGERWLRDQHIAPALRNLLERNGPIAGTTALVDSNESATDAAVRVASEMDGATLCIQGPPGTGKTYTGAKIILELLDQEKRIGIVSNSHKAILNLLSECQHQADRRLPGIKVGGKADDPFFQSETNILHVSDSKKALERYKRGIIAGTSFLFSREDFVDQLDYLIIDEAGQVALANLVAMSGCTQNIIMLGDQMQLSQPVKGTHPGDSGQSALNYYLNGYATIPQDTGIFLPETRRMHPAIGGFISDSIYEGRLTSHASTQEVSIVGQEPGFRFEPVIHTGNTYESEEESQRIVQLVDELLQETYREHGEERPLTLDDILIVAPYNLQVQNLKTKLPEDARVGTVDKFQGQQAPVVILSMAASPGEFGSRGLKFLLDKNRINVALSRAKCRAIVVADPGITASGYRSVEDMARVNLFCRAKADTIPFPTTGNDLKAAV